MSVIVQRNWDFLLASTRVRVLCSICALLLLLNTAVWFAYIYPATQEQDRLKSSSRKARSDIIYLMKRKEIAEVFNSSVKKVSQLEERLSQRNTQSDTIKNIISLAKTSKIKVISNNYEERKASNGYIPLYQEIKLEGEYEHLKMFMGGIKRLPTLTTVIEANIISDEKSKVLKATLVLETQRKK